MPEYEFDTEPGYTGDMTVAVKAVAEAVLKDKYGTPLWLLEIGVWEGRGACWWLDTVLTHPDSAYVGVDNWTSPPGIPHVASRNLAHHRKATLIHGDSREVVLNLPGSFDVIVVDGLHTKEGCYADLVNGWDKLRPGGVMIVDDYGYPGLDGIKLAVDHFTTARGLEFIFRNQDVTAVAMRRDDGTLPGT
jgi:predicted O-methyltransferase YrrM